MSFAKYLVLIGTLAFVLQAQEAAAINQLDFTKAHSLASYWVVGDDPRHRAWAAYLINKYHLADLYSELQSALSNFRPADSGKFTATSEELELESVADAIIRLNIPVTARDARKLYPEFPALAMILLSRTIDDNQAELLSIFEQSKGDEAWLASANLLALHPSSEFVSMLLSGFAVRLRILVYAPGTGGGMSDECSFFVDGRPKLKFPPGWPNFHIYSLQIANSGDSIVAAGVDSVSFETYPADDPTPWISRYAVHPTTTIQILRRNLLVHLAGIKPADVKLRGRLSEDLFLENDEQQYRRDILKIVEEQQASFNDVIGQLKTKGLLDQASPSTLHVQLNIYPIFLNRPLPKPPDLAQLAVVVE